MNEETREASVWPRRLDCSWSEGGFIHKLLKQQILFKQPMNRTQVNSFQYYFELVLNESYIKQIKLWVIALQPEAYLRKKCKSAIYLL